MIRGRKKEMIVTPEGLNVFPEDVERALLQQPGVIDAAVVGAPMPGTTAERVQAILVLSEGADPDLIVRQANLTLGDHQKIRATAVWTGTDLPRTEGTRKLKRRELRTWLAGRDLPAERASSLQKGSTARSVTAVLARFAPGRTMTSDTTIDELGLSSLERVELMMALEETFEVTVDEGAFSAATAIRDLEHLVAPTDWGQTGVRPGSDRGHPPSPLRGFGGTGGRPHDAEIVFPAWNRSLPARAARRVSLPTWILPLGRIFARVTVSGLDHLERIDGPVIFASNHQSHFDGPVILDSLPPKWRYRTAPAMMKEFFNAHFFPERHTRKQWFTNSLNYYLSALFFNAFPLTQGSGGTRQTLRYAGELIGDGYSILIFPEGRRTEAGEIAPFQPGVGMIASRLGVPVVPVRLDGLDQVLPRHARFPSVAHARCTFGAPIVLTGNDYGALAARVEAAVRAL